jgi:hypothetical protein
MLQWSDGRGFRGERELRLVERAGVFGLARPARYGERRTLKRNKAHGRNEHPLLATVV